MYRAALVVTGSCVDTCVLKHRSQSHIVYPKPGTTGYCPFGGLIETRPGGTHRPV